MSGPWTKRSNGEWWRFSDGTTDRYDAKVLPNNSFFVDPIDTVYMSGAARGTVEAMEKCDACLKINGATLPGPTPLEIFNTERAPTAEQEVVMSNEKGVADTAKNIGKSIAGAGALGGQMALAHEANEIVIEAVRHALGDKYPDISDNEVLLLVEQIVAPSILLSLCETCPQYIPKVDLVRRGAELAISAATYEAAIPLLQMLRPSLDKLASVGERIALLEEKPDLAAVPTEEPAVAWTQHAGKPVSKGKTD